MMKYYIAESYKAFKTYAYQNRLRLHDMQYLPADDLGKVMGINLTPENVEIIGDPKCSWSYWAYITSMTTRTPARLKENS